MSILYPLLNYGRRLLLLIDHGILHLLFPRHQWRLLPAILLLELDLVPECPLCMHVLLLILTERVFEH